MTRSNEQDKNGIKKDAIQEQGRPESQDGSFVREQLKERPINKKKLLRRSIITILMAALFGLVACLTVILLVPIFNNWLYPEEPVETVTFSAETEAEKLPEDMALDDEELRKEQSIKDGETEPGEQRQGLDLYKSYYEELQRLAAKVSMSMVTVTGFTSDVDWFDNTYESQGKASGMIAAENGREYLILVEQEPIKNVEKIRVTFYDGTQADGEIKQTDPTTGLAVLSVQMKSMTEDTLKSVKPADLGTSNSSSLTGSPVLALGSPMGTTGSMEAGMVTSTGSMLQVVDAQYRLLTTDIYGSTSGTGVLVNMNGQIIGILNQKYNKDDAPNILSALGISELKKVIARMSNGKSQAYLGILGTEVTREANQEQNVPYGAYITEIEMDSPAMLAGIQSGDIVVAMDESEIHDYKNYVDALSEKKPGDSVSLKIMRSSQNGYTEMSVNVTLTELK